jgi:aminoglycoside phosphotransferase (APT) family kinase protein
VVAGGLEITALARRNLNLHVVRRAGPSYLVKQADPARSGGARTLAHELAFYALCARATSGALATAASALGAKIPRARILRTDPPLLAVEWITGARSPWQLYREAPASRFPVELAAELGSTLASLHQAFAGRAGELASELAGVPSRPADFLSAHRPEPHELRRLSAANLELYRLIQSQPAIGAGLDRARADWRAETLLHGDVRAANTLVLPEPAGSAGRLRLIDWELIKWGDPAWDLGCAMADLVHFWVRGMPREPGLSPARRAAESRVPLRRIQPAFWALWRSYRSGQGEERATERDGLLLRSVRCSAGRLIQAAWQRCSGAASVSIVERELVQVAANVLADPVAAARRLYGWSEEELG